LTLRNCLVSIFSSNYKNLEVIVVDDASSDDSAVIAGQFPCKIIRHKTNFGPAMARNSGAKQANGEILFFLDSDTAVFPNTIDEVVKTLSQPGIDAVVGVYSKEPLNKGFFPEYYALLKYFSHALKEVEKYNVFSAHCAAIKKEYFIDVGGFSRSLRWGEDIENEELGRRIAAKYNIVINPSVQVRHYFGSFKKLVFIFNNRTFWWVRFFLKNKRFEQALTTRTFGLGTIAVPVAFVSLAGMIWSENLRLIWGAIFIFSLLVFFAAYGRFIIFTIKEKKLRFGFQALLATLFFSFLITFAAARAVLCSFWALKKGENF